MKEVVSATRKIFLRQRLLRRTYSTLLIGLLAAAIVSCGQGGETIWSVESRSPDGLWIATGRADRYSGPGNAAIIVGVYLRRTNGSYPEEPVLNFYGQLPPDKSGVDLAIKWLTPSQLQVSFSQPPDLYYQVSRYAGIEISVRNVARPAAAERGS